MYAPLSSGSFRAKAAWPAAGKLNQRKQQERMCFPRCCALSWPKLYLASSLGRRERVRGVREGRLGCLRPRITFYFGYMEARSRVSSPFKEDPAPLPTWPLWWPGSSSIRCQNSSLWSMGSDEEMRPREGKKRGSWRICPTRIIGIWGKKATRVIDCPKPEIVTKWFLEKYSLTPGAFGLYPLLLSLSPQNCPGTYLTVPWLRLCLPVKRGYGFALWLRRWDPTYLVAKKPKNIKQKQCCNKFNKDSKNLHKKKKIALFFRMWPGGTVVKNPPANAGDARFVSSIPGSGRSLGVGNGNPLQYSCLENSTDRGA